MFDFEDPQLIFNLQMNLQRSEERKKDIVAFKNPKNGNGVTKSINKGDRNSKTNSKSRNNSMSTGSPYNPNATGQSNLRKSNWHQKGNSNSNNQTSNSNNLTQSNEFNVKRNHKMQKS